MVLYSLMVFLKSWPNLSGDIRISPKSKAWGLKQEIFIDCTSTKTQIITNSHTKRHKKTVDSNIASLLLKYINWDLYLICCCLGALFLAAVVVVVAAKMHRIYRI